MLHPPTCRAASSFCNRVSSLRPWKGREQNGGTVRASSALRNTAQCTGVCRCTGADSVAQEKQGVPSYAVAGGACLRAEQRSPSLTQAVLHAVHPP